MNKKLYVYKNLYGKRIKGSITLQQLALFQAQMQQRLPALAYYVMCNKIAQEVCQECETIGTRVSTWEFNKLGTGGGEPRGGCSMVSKNSS